MDLDNEELEKTKELINEKEKLDIIKNLMKDNLLIEDNGIFRPIKNTTKQDIYETYYKIQELLKIRLYGEYIAIPKIRIYKSKED